MTVEGDILRPIQGMDVYMATDLATVEANIVSSLKRKLPEIEQLPEFGKSKLNEPFAIAGGGPSIQYTVEELRHFRTILAAGSSHDWLIEHGIRPTYTLILDPDPAAANYLKKPDLTCNYLVASCCDAKVFDRLAGYPVTRWHSAGSDPEWYMKAWKDAGIDDDKKPIIGGGCTCGLRAISIAMVLGYRNLHFFGLDSNLDLNSGAHHAYEFVDPENEHLGDVVPMRLVPRDGDPSNGRLFHVAKYMMAQLWGFGDLISKFGQHFDVTVHGDSIIHEFMRMRREAIAQKAKEASSKAA